MDTDSSFRAVGDAGADSNSKGPLSQAAPCGRGAPRWSVGGQLRAESTAALPGSRLKTCVVPPCSSSVPRPGGVLARSRGPGLQVASSTTLPPIEIRKGPPPPQFNSQIDKMVAYVAPGL